MAHESCFFDSVKVDGVDDRAYTAANWAHYFARLVGNGVFPKPTTGLRVRSSSGMGIVIDPGTAWINGYMFTVTDGTTDSLTVSVANPTLSRIDSVIIGLDLTNRQITPYIRSGSPSSSPEPVSLIRSGSTYELEIAQILVAAGVSQIGQSDITDTRQVSSRCGLVTGLINQVDATGLFDQFTAAFNSWFADLQDTLDTDTAGHLLSRIQALEGVPNVGKFYNAYYVGSGGASKTITLPFLPKRLLITSTMMTTLGNSVAYYKDELDIVTENGNQYSAVFTRFFGNKSGNTVCETVNVVKTSSNGAVILSWQGSTTSACNEKGHSYYVTVWG